MERDQHSTPTDDATDIVTAYRCLDCGAIAIETVGARLYECVYCGTRFNKHSSGGRANQCPVCNRFARMIADDSCAICEDGEVEEIACRLIGDELIPVADATAREAEARIAALPDHERSAREQQRARRARERADPHWVAVNRYRKHCPWRKKYKPIDTIVIGPTMTLYAMWVSARRDIGILYHHVDGRWENIGTIKRRR